MQERNFVKFNRLEKIAFIRKNSIKIGKELHVKEGIRANTNICEQNTSKKTVLCSRLYNDAVVVEYQINRSEW